MSFSFGIAQCGGHREPLIDLGAMLFGLRIAAQKGQCNCIYVTRQIYYRQSIALRRRRMRPARGLQQIAAGANRFGMKYGQLILRIRKPLIRGQPVRVKRRAVVLANTQTTAIKIGEVIPRQGIAHLGQWLPFVGCVLLFPIGAASNPACRSAAAPERGLTRAKVASASISLRMAASLAMNSAANTAVARVKTAQSGISAAQLTAICASAWFHFAGIWAGPLYPPADESRLSIRIRPDGLAWALLGTCAGL